MIKLIAIAAFALGITLGIPTFAQAMPVAPVQAPEGVITDVAFGCGPGMTRVRGVCVPRARIRQTRRAVRRCVLWRGGICRRWVY
ncbi:hypothetical protein V1291_004534 [Nitrobacteraceae bacterium AZCC 1564]